MKEFFKKIWEKWKIIAEKIAVVQTKIILFIIYFTVFMISSLISFILRKDLLDKRKSGQKSFWKDKDFMTEKLDDAKRQF